MENNRYTVTWTYGSRTIYSENILAALRIAATQNGGLEDIVSIELQSPKQKTNDNCIDLVVTGLERLIVDLKKLKDG